MILQGSPQTGFLIKIKANVTKERKRLLLKASRLRKEANVYLRNGPGREADQAPGTRLSEQSPAWPPPLPLSRQRVSAGKCQGVCSEPGSLEIQLQVEATRANPQEAERSSRLKCFTRSASQWVSDAHWTEWKAKVQRGRSHFHHPLPRVSQQRRPILKLTALLLP